MPKNEIKKIGDPKFDSKQPALDYSSSEALEELKIALKVEKLVNLMEHYRIDPKGEHAWMYLALELADHYMPGMQFAEKKGAPTKWDFNNNLRLYALVKGIQYSRPNMSRKEIFNYLPSAAQETLLKDIIKPVTKPSTLETRYDKYLGSSEFKTIEAILKNRSEQEKQELFQHILENKL